MLRMGQTPSTQFTPARRLVGEQPQAQHQPQQLFGEVFPIRTDTLPPLTAYRMTTSGGESTRRLGTKLAEWMGAMFGSFWVWSGGRLITDAPPNPVKLVIAIDDACADQPRIFQHLESLQEDFQWQPSADEIADYVVHGPVARLEETILEALSRTVYSIRSARVVREYHLRTWAVGGAPALSVSVVSRLLYEPDLHCYMETLEKPSDVAGLWVADKLSRLQGEVVKVVGLVDEHRERLLELTQRPESREMIEEAAGDHWVVRVLANAREFDYVADALDLVIRPDDVAQFAINRPQFEKALHLKPALHAQMVKLVADILKDANLIGAAYSTQNAPELYGNQIPKANLAFGSNRVRPYDAARVKLDVKDSGAYSVPKRLESEALRVVIINTLEDDVKDFMEAMKRSLERDFHLKLDVVRERNMRVISQVNLESAVRLLQKETSDLALVFLPDETDADEEEGVSERITRIQTVGRGMPCMIVHEATMNDPDAMTNVIMGLMARARALPYLLADPLPYADRVVGLSLIYHNKREGDFLTGIARIYNNTGALLRCVIAGAALDDGIPDTLLARLLPRDLLHKQRVVIHSDGRLKRDAQRALGSWEDELDATFYPVEVIRAGVPRMYALGKQIEAPHWGSIFRLSDTEAFIQTTEATTQPLHIRTEAPFSIEDATHSVLMFSLFHYGALKQPKLPVTVHNSESIETGILRGVIPSEFETKTPFWL